MRRRELILGVATALVAASGASAQPPMTPTIAFLGATTATALGTSLAGFLRGLRELGFVEGQNIAVEYRWAEGQYDRLPTMAVELAQHGPNIIVAATLPAALAAKAATQTIPIVFFSGGDPVEQGLVASFSRPGSNLTGACVFLNDLGPKRLGLLHEIAPDVTVVGYLANPSNPNFQRQLEQMREAAHTSGVALVPLPATTSSDIDAAFATLAKRRGGGMVRGADPFFGQRMGQIVALSAKFRIPTISDGRQYAADGGLLAYGDDLEEAYQQVGRYAGQILKGAKPGDLPIVRSTKFELFINLKTAQTLGLAVPQLLIAQADEVFE